MIVSVRLAVLGVCIAASFLSIAAQQRGSGATGAQPQSTPAASSGDPVLKQSTNPDGSISSTWTAPDGSLIAQNTFRESSDGTATWNSDSYQNGQLYSSTTFTTNPDGSSVSDTAYPDGRSVVITTDKDGKTSMKETPPPAKPQTTAQTTEPAQVAATPAPATGPPINASLTTKRGADGDLGLVITYTIPAIKIGGGGPAVSPTSPASPGSEIKMYALGLGIQAPPGTKFSDYGVVVGGPGSALHGGCEPVTDSLLVCDEPRPPAQTEEPPGATNQVTVYLPTPLPGTQINELHLNLSADLIGTGKSGPAVASPLIFSLPGGALSTTGNPPGAPSIGVTIAPGPNGTQISDSIGPLPAFPIPRSSLPALTGWVSLTFERRLAEAFARRDQAVPSTSSANATVNGPTTTPSTPQMPPGQNAPAQPNTAGGSAATPQATPAGNAGGPTETDTATGNTKTIFWKDADGNIYNSATTTLNPDGTKTIVGRFYKDGVLTRTETFTTLKDGTTKAVIDVPDAPILTIVTDNDGKIVSSTSDLRSNPSAPAPAAPAQPQSPATRPITVRVGKATLVPAKGTPNHFGLSFTEEPQPANALPGGQSSAASGSTFGSVQVDWDLSLFEPKGQDIDDALSVIIGPGGQSNNTTEPGEPTFEAPSSSQGCTVITAEEAECEVHFTLPASEAPAAPQTPAAPTEADLFFPSSFEEDFEKGLSLTVSGVAVYSQNGVVTGSERMNFDVAGGTPAATSGTPVPIATSGISTPAFTVSGGSGPNGTQINLTAATGSNGSWSLFSPSGESAAGNRGWCIYSALSTGSNGSWSLYQPSGESAAGNRGWCTNFALSTGSTAPNPAAPATASSATAPAPGVPITVSNAGMYVDLKTGQVENLLPSEAAPAGSQLLPPIPLPPGATPGNSISVPTGQDPQLYFDLPSKQLHWVDFKSQRPSNQLEIRWQYPRSWEFLSSASTQAGLKTTTKPSTDYGTGSREEQQFDTAGNLTRSVVYDPSNIVRHTETDFWGTSLGKEYRLGKYDVNYDPKGNRELSWNYSYDLNRRLTFSDTRYYDLHGGLDWEQTSTFVGNGYWTRDWTSATDSWSSQFTAYKTPAPGAATQPTYTPTTTSLGELNSRNYSNGKFFVGSIGPSTWADGFNGVPIVNVSDFTLPVRTLPDGSLSCSDLEVGFTNNGWSPLGTDCRYTLRTPLNWSGPYTVNVRETDPLPTLGPSTATFNLGDRFAPPTLPSNMVPSNLKSILVYSTKLHLIDLWNEAFDIESDINEAYAATYPNWDYIDWLKGERSDIYDDIDSAASHLPASEVSTLAQSLSNEANGTAETWATQTGLTSDDLDDINDLSGWAQFLKDEASHFKFWSTISSFSDSPTSYWVNLFFNEGKLNVVHGGYSDFPLATRVSFGNTYLRPTIVDPSGWYAMPPTGSAIGLNNYNIIDPFYGITTLLSYGMKWTMWADDYHLKSGMSTNWHGRLDVSNDPVSPGVFNGQPVPEPDLIGPSEESSIQKAAPSSGGGYWWVSIENGSTGIISMQNQSRTYTAADMSKGFVQLDGVLTAVRDGNFNIIGWVRANSPPEAGIGDSPIHVDQAGLMAIPTGTPGVVGFQSTGRTFNPSQIDLSGTGPVIRAGVTNWLPALSASYNPSAPSSAPMNCSAPAAAAAAPGATTSTTATPTNPTATPPTATPSTATTPPTGSSSSGCPNPALVDLYTLAGNSIAVPVDNNPTTAEIDAAKKRVADARENLKAAVLDLRDARVAEGDAWAQGLYKIPQEFQDGWKEMNRRLERSVYDLNQVQLKYSQNPTPENLRAFESAKARATADGEEQDQLRKNILENEFSAQDRNAYQNAVDQANSAQDKVDDAEAEKRDAEYRLGELLPAAATK